jgi:hypothetical protein
MTRGRASSPTGLDSWSGRAVSEHVADWMGDGINRGMSEVADRLAPEGTRLLTRGAQTNRAPNATPLCCT